MLSSYENFVEEIYTKIPLIAVLVRAKFGCCESGIVLVDQSQKMFTSIDLSYAKTLYIASTLSLDNMTRITHKTISTHHDLVVSKCRQLPT